MNDLVPTNEAENPMLIFADRSVLDKILAVIERKVECFEPDTSTANARGKIASLAYKVSKSKTFLDNAGKGLSKDWKEKSKLVDSARKEIRDRLDALRDKVREPLTLWEKAEAERVEKKKLSAQYDVDFDEALAINDLLVRELILEKKIRDIAEAELRLKEVERNKQIAQDRKDRDEEIKRAALLEAARQVENERSARIAADKELVEAKERAAAEAIYAKRMAEEEVRKAVFEATRAAEQKAIAEKDALERERIAAETEAKARAEDMVHKGAINRFARNAFIEHGVDANVAKKIVILVAQDNIPGISMDY